MKLPIAQADREQVLRTTATELLASLPDAALDKEVRVIWSLGEDIPSYHTIRYCLDRMSRHPHSEYLLAGAGPVSVVGLDEDAPELVGGFVGGRNLVEALTA